MNPFKDKRKGGLWYCDLGGIIGGGRKCPYCKCKQALCEAIQKVNDEEPEDQP